MTFLQNFDTLESRLLEKKSKLSGKISKLLILVFLEQNEMDRALNS